MKMIDIYTDNNLYDFQYLDSFEKGFGIVLSKICPNTESIFYLYSKLHNLCNLEYSNKTTFKERLNQYISILQEKLEVNLLEINLSDKVVTDIIKELNNEHICFIIIDLYDLYYSEYYKKEHIPYLLIINGFDIDQDVFSIIDTQQTTYLGENEGLVYAPFRLSVQMLEHLIGLSTKRYNQNKFYSISTTGYMYKNSMLQKCLSEYMCHKESIIQYPVENICKQLQEEKKEQLDTLYFERQLSALVRNTFVFLEEIDKLIIRNFCEVCTIKSYAELLVKELEKIKKTFLSSLKRNTSLDYDVLLKNAFEIETKIKSNIYNFYDKIIDPSFIEDSKPQKDIFVDSIFENKNNEVIKSSEINYISKNEALLRDIIKRNTSLDDFPVTSTLNSLGINSIMALKIMHEIYKEFDVEIPLKFFLEDCNFTDILSFIETSKKDNSTSSKLTKKEKRLYYPLGRFQKDLIMYTSRLYGDGLAYNITLVLDKQEKFDKNRLLSAFKLVINKHEAFRMNFCSIQNDDYLIVNDSVDFQLDTATISYAERDSFFSNWIRPFNLEESILIRACLVEYNDNSSSSLIIDVHHIIVDGGSINILLRELADFYNKKNISKTNEVDFTDFIVWENEFNQINFYKKQQDFWEKYYSDGMPILKLPVDFSNVPSQAVNYEAVLCSYMYNKDFNKLLSIFSQKYGFTNYMILLSVISILLNKYTSQKDLVIWTPTANRQLAEQINMIGMFVNTVPVRNILKENETFLDLLKQVKDNCINVFSNTGLDINGLSKKIKLKNNSHIHQLVFIYQNYESNSFTFDEETITPFRINQNITRFDLLIEAYENDKQTKVVVKYKPQLFKQDTIDNFIAQVENLTVKLLDNPNIKISEITI